MPFADRLPSLRRGLAAALIVLVGGASAWGFVPRRTGLVVRCSPTVLQTVQGAAEEFMQAHADVRICVLPGSPRRTRKAVSEGTADLGLATRSDQPEDHALTREPLGREALAFVVHPSNPVTSLDLEEAARLFSGQARAWDAVGGRKAPVHVYAGEPTSGLYEILKAQVLGPHRVVTREATWVPDAEMLRRVAADPDALGYLHLGHVGPGVGVVAVEEVVPSVEMVRARRYLVHEELELLRRPDASPLVQEFAKHLASSDRFLTERLVVPLP